MYIHTINIMDKELRSVSCCCIFGKTHTNIIIKSYNKSGKCWKIIDQTLYDIYLLSFPLAYVKNR